MAERYRTIVRPEAIADAYVSGEIDLAELERRMGACLAARDTGVPYAVAYLQAGGSCG
jgi:hypothetical protein